MSADAPLTRFDYNLPRGPRTLRDEIEYLRLAACDPTGPLYGSDLVPAVDDVTLALLRFINQTPDVNQAAGRLRQLWHGGTMDSVYGANLSLEGQRVYCSFDMEKCARAFVAAGPTPMTQPRRTTMATDKVIWQSYFGVNETVRDLAKRFVEEFFGVERTIIWDKATPAGPWHVFWLSDSAWKYRLICEKWVATVARTGEPSPRGKAYTKARRLARPLPEPPTT